MLNIKNGVMKTQEELTQFTQLKRQQIRDILLEIEQAEAMYHDRSVLLTREEVAEKLRTDVKHIPHAIPRMRMGNKSLYQLGDIEDFILSKKK